MNIVSFVLIAFFYEQQEIRTTNRNAIVVDTAMNNPIVARDESETEGPSNQPQTDADAAITPPVGVLQPHGDHAAGAATASDKARSRQQKMSKAEGK